MNPDEIAQVILRSLNSGQSAGWSYEVGTASVLVELHFRPMVSAMLDIHAVAGCFATSQRVSISAYSSSLIVGDEPARIVFDGSVNGKHVVAVFELTNAGS